MKAVVEPHDTTLADRSNSIRAAVLGANDGIVSIAGLVVGVAGATSDSTTILTAGLAGLVAGALSMGTGEYVSVSSQRDTEQASVARETAELENDPEGELAELEALYLGHGLAPETAAIVARELTAHDALRAHAMMELKIEPGAYVSPWSAAVSSLLAFTAGALLPLLAILLAPDGVKVAVTFVAVVIALAITGFISARLGGAPIGRAVLRNIAGGAISMAITYGIGALIGTSV